MSDAEFSDATQRVERIHWMDNETVRKVYAYYKQATVGDVSKEAPVKEVQRSHQIRLLVIRLGDEQGRSYLGLHRFGE